MSSSGLLPGTSGVFVTCQRGHEFQCVGELYALFDEVPLPIPTPLKRKFYRRLWGDTEMPAGNDQDDDGGGDIESSIAAELSKLKSNKQEKPFYSVKMSQECGTPLNHHFVQVHS